MAFSTYSAYGMQISSALDLPLNRLSSGDSRAEGGPPADVVIRFGDVPLTLQNPMTSTPVIQVTSREFLFGLTGVGRFLIRDGRDVCVQYDDVASEYLLGLHVAHSGLAAVLHQRGEQPLHASGVLVDGGCVAFLGGSNAGKSTIAAALYQRGYAALCDDICPVKFAGGIASVGAGTGRLELWADAARALGLNADSAWRAHPESERYRFPTDLPAIGQPIPLRRLYVIRESGPQTAGIQRLSGIEAFRYLLGNTVFSPHLRGFGKDPKTFAEYAEISRSIPIFEWYYSRGLDRLAATIDCLEQHLQSDPPNVLEIAQ